MATCPPSVGRLRPGLRPELPQDPCRPPPGRKGAVPGVQARPRLPDPPGPGCCPYLIRFQLLVSENGRLVAHGEPAARTRGQALEAPLSTGPHQLPGCCASACGQISLPWLSPAHPPVTPSLGRLKLQLGSLGNSPRMSTATGARRRAVRGHRAALSGETTPATKIGVQGSGAPPRDGQGGGEAASTPQLKFQLSPNPTGCVAFAVWPSQLTSLSLICKMEITLVPTSRSRSEDLTRSLRQSKKKKKNSGYKPVLGSGSTIVNMLDKLCTGHDDDDDVMA